MGTERTLGEALIKTIEWVFSVLGGLGDGIAAVSTGVLGLKCVFQLSVVSGLFVIFVWLIPAQILINLFRHCDSLEDDAVRDKNKKKEMLARVSAFICILAGISYVFMLGYVQERICR